MDLQLDKYKILRGDFIELNEIKPGDAELIYNWRTGPGGELMNQPEGYNLDSQRRWMSSRPANEINYIITDLKSGTPVGMIAIVGISTQDKNAEVGRLLLATEYLNKSNPFGLEALKLCYNVIINEWKFHKIYGNIINPAMLKMQKFLGMQVEGVLKQQKVLNGQMHDLHLVAIFEKELNKYYLPRLSMLLKSFKD